MAVSDDFTTTSSFEDKDLLQYIQSAFPNTFYIRSSSGNNCYVYNNVFFEDISDQQYKNDFNLSIGQLYNKTLGQGKATNELDEEGKPTGYMIIKNAVLKYYDIHIWSCTKNSIEVSRLAEMVRLCVRGHSQALETSANIDSGYRTLDKTNIPLNDAAFYTEIQCSDTFRYGPIEQFEDFTLTNNILHQRS